MELHFTKLHGLGNDFVFVDDFSREIDLDEEQVAWLCDRHFGIGADGVILVRPSERDDCIAYMHYINADGSLAQMCGNGVRCFAKYLVDRGFVPSSEDALTVETLAGPRHIEFSVDERGKMDVAHVDMGAPILDPSTVPCDLQADGESNRGEKFVRDVPLESPWGTFRFTCVSMGNPHAVCFLEDFDVLPESLFSASSSARSLETFKIDEIGAFFESHPAFPEKTNVEFATVGGDGIRMRVFERGCGETMACGTGACATLVSSVLTGRSPRSNTVKLNGGSLSVEWEESGHVMMAGPAVESFEGTVVL